MTHVCNCGKYNKKSHGLLWYIFCGFGAFVLWLHYYFGENRMQSINSARGRGKPLIEFIYTLPFLSLVLFFTYAYLATHGMLMFLIAK